MKAVSVDHRYNRYYIFFFSACVNCVRWSASGKFLASGGDDKIVMIWQIGRCVAVIVIEDENLST